MKVTVWGGSGFLGSHVCDVLTENGHEVTIADTIESQWKNNEQRMLVGNILDHDSINESVKNADYVFNFAGIADIDTGTAALDELFNFQFALVAERTTLGGAAASGSWHYSSSAARKVSITSSKMPYFFASSADM